VARLNRCELDMMTTGRMLAVMPSGLQKATAFVAGNLAWETVKIVNCRT